MKNLFLVIGLILGPVVVPFIGLTLVEYVRFRKNPNRFYDATDKDEDEE